MLKKLKSVLAVLAMVAAIGVDSPARATQGSCVMPTSGTVSGLTLVNNINVCEQSQLSLYSGGSAPTSPVPAMLWYDTSTSYIRQYDGAVWLPLWYVDATNHLMTPQIGGGAVNINLTSAATTDLGSVPQPTKGITGSASITSFGSSAQVGSIHNLGFSGSVTIVASANMTLPGGGNIITQNGDTATVIYLGLGRWKMFVYQDIGRSPMMVAYSLMGNPTASPFGGRDITATSLTQKATPVGADRLVIFDSAASNAIKYVTASSLAALAGVVSIDGQTGTFTTNNGFSCPSNVCGLTAARRTLPTFQTLTASSGTYTTPANVLWIEWKLVGGGGGGGGGNNGSAATGGGTTCLALSGAACSSPILFANGGGGSSYTFTAPGGTPMSGGVVSNGSGNSGGPGSTPGLNHNGLGGSGGPSCVGGAAPGSVGAAAGTAAVANSGAGGGGGGNTNGTLDGGGGSGGASGACTTFITTSPAATYTYAIGPGGAGAAGASINSSSGGAGGAGGSGRIEVIEHYGSWLFIFVGFLPACRRRAANDNADAQREAA